MGCAGSRQPDINDQHPNVFQVMNVDEAFRPISPGQIEITDAELVFHQRAKPPTTWSLRNLRKYGFDGEIFSFECGRRCATGEGIFAFKCRKAEQLFNLLQANIQLRNLSEDVSLAAHAQQQQRRSTPDGYLNPAASNGRPGSVASNGPTTPPPPPPPPPPLPPENNNNKSACAVAGSHSYLNLPPGGSPPSAQPQYINLPNGNLYMNVDAALAHALTAHPNPVSVHEADDERDAAVHEPIVLPQLPPTDCPTCFEDRHCYANVEGGGGVVPPTPMEVNYVELDLEPAGALAPLRTTDVVVKGKPYVTIDFKKTDALSNSINPRLELEEGCRKTRHNSTIGDIRHSSSISD